MKGLISREAAKIALIKKGQSSKRYKLGETWELNCSEIMEALDAVLDEDPEDTQKVYWDSGITANGNARCSKCGFLQIGVYDREGFQAYCGHCGAKMTGVRRSALWRLRT